jgi:hypothetical protein
MPQDPGERIALDVTVTPQGAMPPAAPSALPPPVYTPRSGAPLHAPPPVYAPPVVYGPPAYYYGASPVVVQPGIVIGVGVGGHWRHGRWH